MNGASVALDGETSGVRRRGAPLPGGTRRLSSVSGARVLLHGQPQPGQLDCLVKEREGWRVPDPVRSAVTVANPHVHEGSQRVVHGIYCDFGIPDWAPTFCRLLRRFRDYVLFMDRPHWADGRALLTRVVGPALVLWGLPVGIGFAIAGALSGSLRAEVEVNKDLRGPEPHLEHDHAGFVIPGRH